MAQHRAEAWMVCEDKKTGTDLISGSVLWFIHVIHDRAEHLSLLSVLWALDNHIFLFHSSTELSTPRLIGSRTMCADGNYINMSAAFELWHLNKDILISHKHWAAFSFNNFIINLIMDSRINKWLIYLYICMWTSSFYLKHTTYSLFWTTL